MANIALPKLDILADCADYTLTVKPFFSHLTALPSKLLAAGLDCESLRDVYVETNPLMMAVAVTAVVAPIFFIVSEINRNYSQVDRCWSLLPVLYNAHYALWARLNGLPTSVVDAILAITIAWSARLTFNYWRKGGYKKGSEDYRWAIVQEKLNNRFLFSILNVTFISTLQPLLLFLVTAPTYVMVLYSTLPYRSHGLEIFDWTCIEALVFFLVCETLADQQQWRYQNAKHEYQKIARVPDEYKGEFTADDLNRGFVIHGLWSWCRHPNFAAEQAIWITFHQWCCLKSRTWFNWAGIGALCYVLLFQASTNLTEKITAKKYPEYKDYQRCVGMFVPRYSVEPIDGDDSDVSSEGSRKTQ